MSQLVSCGKNIVTHNLSNAEPVATFNPHQSNVNCAVWNHNNQVIASCGNDGSIFLSHSLKTQVLLQLEDDTTPHRPILSLGITSNSQFIASGGQDGMVKIWDLKKKAVASTLKGHFSQVNCVNWNNLDSLVASCSNAGEIIIHDVSTQLQIANFSLNGKTPGFKCVRFSPLRKSHLISGSNDGSLTVWDVTLRDQVANFSSQHSSKVTAIACSLFNENLICSSGIDQKVHFYDLAQKSVMRTLQCDNPLTALAFHNDGYTLAVGTLYGSVLIYDLRQTQTPRKQLKGHENSSVNYLEFLKITDDERLQISKDAKKEMIKSSTSINSIKDENQMPTLKAQVNQSFLETEKKLDMSKTSITALEEIKRETLQRLEQSKQEKARISSQKPPVIQSSQSIQQQGPQSAVSEKLSAKDSAAKSYSQVRQTFENYSGKIEDLNRKYDKQPVQAPSAQAERKQEQGLGFTEEQKRYLNDLMNEQMIHIKHYVADQVGSLHIDMIRQFQIQQNDMQAMFDKYLYDQNLLTSKIQQLEQENAQIRRTSY